MIVGENSLRADASAPVLNSPWNNEGGIGKVTTASSCFSSIVHDNLLYDEKCKPPNFALYQCSGSLLLFECNRWIEAAEDIRCADF
jgi:hypothetical protein